MTAESENRPRYKGSNFPKYRNYPVENSRKYLVFGKEIKLINRVIQGTSDFPLVGKVANVYIRPLHELSVSYICRDFETGNYVKKQIPLGSGRFRTDASAQLEARRRDEMLRRR